MYITCPYCRTSLWQTRNRDGPNFCSACQHLFTVMEQRAVPSWVYGVLVILIAHLQIINH